MDQRSPPEGFGLSYRVIITQAHVVVDLDATTDCCKESRNQRLGVQIRSLDEDILLCISDSRKKCFVLGYMNALMIGGCFDLARGVGNGPAGSALPPHGLRQTIAIGIGWCVGWGIRVIISSPGAHSGASPFVSGWIVVSGVVSKSTPHDSH